MDQSKESTLGCPESPNAELLRTLKPGDEVMVVPYDIWDTIGSCRASVIKVEGDRVKLNMGGEQKKWVNSIYLRMT